MSFHLRKGGRDDGRDILNQKLTGEEIVEAVREWLARKGRLPYDADTVLEFEIPPDGEIVGFVRRG